MVFNPMSTTIVCSITLLQPSRCSVYLPLPASRHRRKVRWVYYTQLCVCFCVREHVIRSYMDYALQKAVPRLVLKGLKLAEVVENVTTLVMSRSDDDRLPSHDKCD